jgi:hypothetical protein
MPPIELGEGFLDVLPRTSQFASQLTRQLQPSLARAGAQLKSTGTTLTRNLTLPLVAGGVAMVKLASDAQETRNVTNEVFGAMADDMTAWSDTAIDRLGIASATAEGMANRFGLLFKAAKLPGPEVVGLSQDFAQLTVDASSFFNVDSTTALDKLRSGLAGESEPLRDFGVFINEAAVQSEALRLGLVRTGQELTEQQKIVARASLIQKGLSDATGDYARTQDSTANSTRRATEKLKELGAEFGQDLLPVATEAIGVASDLLDRFQDLSPESRALAIKLGLLAVAAGPVVRTFGSIVSLGAKATRVMGNIGTTAATSTPGVAGNAKAIGAWAVATLGVALAEEKIRGEFTRTSTEADRFFGVLKDGTLTVEQLDAQIRSATEAQVGVSGLGTLSQVGDVASDTELWEARNRAVEQFNAHLYAQGQRLSAVARETLKSQGASQAWHTTITQNVELTTRQAQKLGGALNVLTLYDNELTDSERAAINALVAQGHFASAMDIVNRNIRDGVGALGKLQHAHEAAKEATADHDFKVLALGTDIRRIEGRHEVDVGVKITGADRLAGIASQLAALTGQHDISVDFRGGGGHALAAGGILGVPAGASGFIARQPVLVGEATTPTPFGRGAEAVVPFDSRGIGILAEALGMALDKRSGGSSGGALSDGQIDRLGKAIGRAAAEHSHDVSIDGTKVAEAVGRHQGRSRMVRG